jgi:hypothetical protein
MTITGGLSYLLDAGWLFFAGWSLMVVTVSVIAFGKDFVPVPPLFPLFEERAFEKQRPRISGKAVSPAPFLDRRDQHERVSADRARALNSKNVIPSGVR